MEGRVDIHCAVPARLASSRFPGKMLKPLDGAPLVVHALRRAREAGCFARVVCLTDSSAILEAVQDAGFDALLTGEASNGTERIALSLDRLGAERVVNLQGDEPLFPPEALRFLAARLAEAPEEVHTFVHGAGPDDEELRERNRVKALVARDGRILDFRRLPGAVPEGAQMRVHAGVYAYSRLYLENYAAAEPSARELEESHEMLRDLSLAPLRAHPLEHRTQAVDTETDLRKVEAMLAALSLRAANSMS